MQTAASSSGHVDVSISLGGGFGTRRRQRRGFAVLPLTIRANGSEHVGLLRDISPSGLFFYSDAKPAVGSILTSQPPARVFPSAPDHRTHGWLSMDPFPGARMVET